MITMKHTRFILILLFFMMLFQFPIYAQAYMSDYRFQFRNDAGWMSATYNTGVSVNGIIKATKKVMLSSGVVVDDLLAEIADYADSVFIGSLRYFAFIDNSAFIESGWITCNGQEVLRSEYPKLYGVIGTYWGDGDGLTTFNVPDFNSGQYFMRGLDDMGSSEGAASQDPDSSRAIGSFQEQAIQKHEHEVNDLDHLHSITLESHQHDWTNGNLISGIRHQGNNDSLSGDHYNKELTETGLTASINSSTVTGTLEEGALNSIYDTGGVNSPLGVTTSTLIYPRHSRLIVCIKADSVIVN
jgi:microcystin-dependent protein